MVDGSQTAANRRSPQTQSDVSVSRLSLARLRAVTVRVSAHRHPGKMSHQNRAAVKKKKMAAAASVGLLVSQHVISNGDIMKNAKAAIFRLELLMCVLW